MVVININDLAITVSRNGETEYAEPGIAIVTDKETLFGRHALNKSRLDPTHTHTRYWQQLSNEPILPTGPGVRNQADLIYKQLLEIKRTAGIETDEPIIVLVDGNTTQTQLSLLLGIAKEAEINIQAFVDIAVAGTKLHSLPDRSTFLDISWHRGLLTDVAHNEEITGGNVTEIHSIGLAYLIESWVTVIADQFVAETRFDPLRIAQTEQQVFNQVVGAYESSIYNLTITTEYDGSTRRIDVDKEAFANKILPRLEQITQAIEHNTTFVIPKIISGIPGLIEHLKSKSHDVIIIDSNAPAVALHQRDEEFFRRESVQFLRSLPRDDLKRNATTEEKKIPTHLLTNHLAMPINKALSSSGDPNYERLRELCNIVLEKTQCVLIPLADKKIIINGELISKAANLAIGDIIKVDTLNFQLIYVPADG